MTDVKMGAGITAVDDAASVGGGAGGLANAGSVRHVRPGLLSRFSLPLLTRELRELAARRRTYSTRMIYVAIFSVLALYSIKAQWRTANWWDMLGQGLPILKSLASWEFMGIYAFLPALACGVFTTEKERNTLGLLFLTRLGPWTIIVEKLLSRLFPMLMILLCALPVMAFTYSLGGISAFDLFCVAWFLVLAALQATAVAVMCSAWSRSTTAAFIQTYIVLLSLTFGPVVLSTVIPGVYLDIVGNFLATWQPPSGNRIYGVIMRGPTLLLQIFSPTHACSVFIDPWMRAPTPPWALCVIMGLPTLCSTLFCLLVARLCLYRRAFIQPVNRLLGFFQGLDKMFVWANHRVARDIKLVRESDVLPGDEPIAWREVSKRALGQVRYLVRIVIPMMFPVIFVGLFVASANYRDWDTNSSSGLSPLMLCLWFISLALIVVMSANTMPLERTRQSWDVLRCLPLAGRDILRQKLRGVRRLQWICSIPVLSAIAIEAWWRQQLFSHGLATTPAGTPFNDQHYLWWEYLFGAVTSVWIYGELAKWIAMWCGLIFRNSMRAIVSALVAVASMTIVPFVIVAFLVVTVTISILPVYNFMDVRGILFSISPYIFITHNEMLDLRTMPAPPLVPALINLAWHGTLLLILRRHILRRADWYLGRIGPRSVIRSHVDDAASVGGGSGRVANAGSVRHVGVPS